MIKLRKTTALGLLSALFIGTLATVPAAANDGHEFYITRKANNPSGKIMTAEDVVYNPKLTPVSAVGYYENLERRNRTRNGVQYPVAVTKNQSLYVIRAKGDSVLVAKGGDGIVYGESVSRNEFGINGGIFMSPDKSKVAFYRKDESRVALFPLLDITKPGGALKAIRYPMAGTSNTEKIDLGIYDLASGKTVYADVDGEFGWDQYLTNISWDPESAHIYIQVLDREQQNVRLIRYSAADGSRQGIVLSEHSNTWVEPQEPLQWIKGRNNLAIYTTDNRDNFWNLYLIDVNTNKIERLTPMDRDVHYLANDGKYVYFTAPDFHPVNNYLWKVDIKTKKVEQMTTEVGWHSISMSEDCSTYVDVYERLDMAPRSVIKSTKNNKVISVLQESLDPTTEYAFTEITMGTVTSANGQDLNYYRMIKPKDFDPNKKYPLILYVYGGPHSQLVRNTFLGSYRRWEMYMAQRGYVVFVMDGRGTPNHGAKYEHSIYRQCGQNEMADQMQAINMLRYIPWIDEDRIGVYGWSYGGFMSLSLSTNYNDVFKVCAAGGPVIDWKWYEVMYGERYMSTPQNNPEGFAKTSLLNKAKDVKAKTLVIEGGNDDTVVPQHALSFLQECINNNIPVEYFTYPNAGHNMRGQDRVHLVEKISAHFIENL